MSEPSLRKIKIIVNPNAGSGKGRKFFPLLRQKLLERNIPFHLQFSENPEHVSYLARQALQEGYEFIVSAGGDGTAHRILQFLVGNPGVLGFIPLGRGNDIPKNLGIQEDLDLACDLLKDGRVRTIDVIEVNGKLYFAGVGGIGFDAEVNALANRLTRYLKNDSAYSLPVYYKILAYRSKKISLETDQEFRQGSIFMAAFGNMKTYGRGMQITPMAEPDDGAFDVCWIDPVKRLRLYRFSPTVYTGNHLDFPEVHYLQATCARVESDLPMDLYADGEWICQTPFTLQIRPRALNVLVP